MTTEEKLKEQLQITQQCLESINDMNKELQKFINKDEMSYERAYFSLSKFIGKTYIANQKTLKMSEKIIVKSRKKKEKKENKLTLG